MFTLNGIVWTPRAIFVWPWNENAQTKQKQKTNENRAIWLVYRTDMNARGFWLVKRTLGWKNFMPENFLEINRYFALTSHCNTIGQSNNVFSILGCFFWRENEEAMFWPFHPLADKTNNEHLKKQFFKVVRKSLYPLYLTFQFRDRRGAALLRFLCVNRGPIWYTLS